MCESLELFRSVMDTPWLQKAHAILFFNKLDVFNRKIGMISLNVCFPEFTGNSFQQAIGFITTKFTSVTSRPVHVHHLSALNASAMIASFNAIVQLVRQSQLTELL
jgi:guanine nucleotide-binding protein G(i) subunit alpha